MSTMTEQTFAAHLQELQQRITEAWTSGSPKRIAKVRSEVVAVCKLMNDIRNSFDHSWDNRAVLGSDFPETIKRIHEKRGRKTASVVVDKYAALTASDDDEDESED